MKRYIAILETDDLSTLTAFERQVIPILREHGGQLLTAFAAAERSAKGHHVELHVLSFPDGAAFAAYRADPRHAALADLRARAIVSTTVYSSAEIKRY